MIVPDREGGSVLVLVIAILLILTVGAGVLAALTTTGGRVGAGQSDSVQAFYHAESGLEWAAWEMRRQVRQGEDYTTACSQLDEYQDPDGRYRINVLVSQPSECRLEFLGAVPAIDSPNAERRLRVTINRRAVEGEDPNTVQNPDNWANACAGGIRSCNDDGSVTFSNTSGSERLNRGGAEDLVDSDAFTSAEEVFLFLRFREGEAAFTDFGLNKVPQTGDRRWSTYREDDLPEGYDAGVSLGSGFTPQELNDEDSLQFVIEWDGDLITIEASCIGTRAACRGGGNDPADQWGEE